MWTRALGMLLLVSIATSLSAPAFAQGSFVEHEVAPVKAIDVALVNGTYYVLVCNTPDNSVEIYHVVNPGELSFVQRVPVGLAPVSVHYVPSLNRFYTANLIGDSVSRVDFPTGGSAVATLVATTLVGDSPCDLALSPLTGYLEVLLSSRSSLIYLDAGTLAPANLSLNPLVLLDFSDPNAPVMKEPRRILYESNRVHILSLRGDNGFDRIAGVAGGGFQFDMISADFTNPAAIVPAFVRNGLGSTNMGIAASQDGRLFIVGSLARNDIAGKQGLRTQSDGLSNTGPNGPHTGFVESHLYVVQTASLFPGPIQVQDRNLNLTSTARVVPAGTGPSNLGQRVSMPTDVALLESSSGTLQKVFVTSFSTDKIVVLTPNPQRAMSWPSTVIDIPFPTGGGYTMSGPVCLAIKPAVATSTDPGARLYCLNRNDNSISVIDPLTNTHVTKIALANDPTPSVVRGGRFFLYEALGTSFGQMDSCASCHVFAHTDGLAWKLDDPTNPAAPVPSYLPDGVVDAAFVSSPAFPGDRQAKVTQSLRGLVNHPVAGDAQVLFSNAPYHWRGDKPQFTDFNEAFVNLMGLPLNSQSTNGGGITDAQMIAFRDFIDQVMYPPNPDEPYTRVHSGALGLPNSETTGSGGLLGLKLFHIKPLTFNGAGGGICAGRSCVGCHSLPEGSSNTISLTSQTADPFAQPLVFQPLESTALRSLGSREGIFETSSAMMPMPPNGALRRTSTAGLTQGGAANLSINGFTTIFFAPDFTAPPGTFDYTGASGPNGGLAAGEQQQLEAVIQFCREFDTGVAPSVGPALTVTTSNACAAAPLLALGETQAQRANCGIAVYRRVNGTAQGLYYDVTQNLYVDVASPTTTFTTSQLLGLTGCTTTLGANDVVIVEGVHVGSERRVASLTGIAPAPPPTQPTPSGITLLPAMPATHWAFVPQFTKNWSPPAAGAPGPNDFVWQQPSLPEPKSLKAMRLMQNALITAGGFGPTAPRHEAPRRFRVSGTNIRHGAKLRLRMPHPQSPGVPPPYANVPANTFLIELDLQPAIDPATNTVVWETTAEVDPFVLYMMMNGGIWAPDVMNLFLGVFPSPGQPTLLSPTAWNQYTVEVVNEGNPTPSTSILAPITAP
ncbi:MAG: hypothetical protein HY292_03725 [Planctomycetes bacterium]|nr:hypothetical protein [Planctomycetota bacterium]